MTSTSVPVSEEFFPVWSVLVRSFSVGFFTAEQKTSHGRLWGNAVLHNISHHESAGTKYIQVPLLMRTQQECVHVHNADMASENERCYSDWKIKMFFANPTQKLISLSSLNKNLVCIFKNHRDFKSSSSVFSLWFSPCIRSVTEMKRLNNQQSVSEFTPLH